MSVPSNTAVAEIPHWLPEMRAALAAAEHASATLATLHRWHACTLAPIAIEAAETLGGSALRQRALRALHLDALDALPADAATWRASFAVALRDLIGLAYERERAMTVAYAGGLRYATDNGLEDPEGFGRYYAELNTEASLALCARTHAAAMADLLGEAFANEDPHAYANARPASLIALHLKAWLRAHGRDFDDAQTVEGLRKRIAEGWAAARAAV